MKKTQLLLICLLFTVSLFAQYDEYSGLEEKSKPDYFILFLVFAAIVIVSIIIARLTFSIPTFLKHQKAQTILLIKIARQKGVSENEIENVINIIEGKGNIENDHTLIRYIDKKDR